MLEEPEEVPVVDSAAGEAGERRPRSLGGREVLEESGEVTLVDLAAGEAGEGRPRSTGG